MKKEITRTLGGFSCSDFDGATFPKIVELLQSKMKDGSTLDYDYDGYFTVVLTGIETDEEYQHRVADELLRTKRIEDKEKE
jgi:hypothetical protein